MRKAGEQQSGGQEAEGALDRDLAVAQIVGAVVYALLRVFQVAAQVTLSAPTFPLRERQAAFAVEEFERYRNLRLRLNILTGNPEVAIDRFRPAIDAFYDAAPVDGWVAAQVFHFVGDAITTDFAELIGPFLDERTAVSIREALTGRAAHEMFALGQIESAVAASPEIEEQVVHLARRVVGEALNRVRDALLESDALALVLGGEQAVKEMILEILARQRERLERLGLESLD